MLGPLLSHAVIYLAVSLLLSLLWVVSGDGTLGDLGDYATAPGSSLTLSFWPIWVWLIWGTGVVVHGAVVIGNLLRPGLWARRLRTIRELRSRGVPPPEAVLTGVAGQKLEDALGAAGRHNLVAMFTDITDSTVLNEAMGDLAWTDVLAGHRSLVRRLTAQHGGSEVGTQGDGFFMRFDDARAAVDCAIDIQSEMAMQRRDDPALPAVRVGLHLGEAIHADSDVLGRVVNLAARVQGVAGPGEIVLTEAMADALGEVALEDLGLVELKGIDRRRHLFRVVT